MRRLSRAYARLLFWVAVAAIAMLAPGWSVSAQENQAGLIVVHGDGRQSFVIVQFESESIPAVEILARSGLVVTELNFGALGMAVCDIDGTGCDVATCRKRVCQGSKPDDPFWQLFIRSDDGEWQPAPLGISSESLADGAVRALIWTGADPTIPAYTMVEVAAKAGAIGADGVALTRYSASGEVLSPSNPDESGFPVGGLAAVGIAAAFAVALIVRRQMGSR